MKTEQKKIKPKMATSAGYKKPLSSRKYAGADTSLDPFLKAMLTGKSGVKKK